MKFGFLFLGVANLACVVFFPPSRLTTFNAIIAGACFVGLMVVMAESRGRNP